MKKYIFYAAILISIFSCQNASNPQVKQMPIYTVDTAQFCKLPEGRLETIALLLEKIKATDNPLAKTNVRVANLYKQLEPYYKDSTVVDIFVDVKDSFSLNGIGTHPYTGKQPRPKLKITSGSLYVPLKVSFSDKPIKVGVGCGSIEPFIRNGKCYTQSIGMDNMSNENDYITFYYHFLY